MVYMSTQLVYMSMWLCQDHMVLITVGLWCFKNQETRYGSVAVPEPDNVTSARKLITGRTPIHVYQAVPRLTFSSPA